MSIADKIESIEEHLKADYNAIEKLIDVNVDKNIENIASLVDSIYDKFPKTDYEEGTEITLSNTLKGKLDFEKIYQEVEYIEGTGTQYITTDYYQTSDDMQLKTKVYIPEMLSTEQDIVGNQDNQTGRFVLGMYQKKIFGYSRSNTVSEENVYSNEYNGSQILDINMTFNSTNKTKILVVNGVSTNANYNSSISNTNKAIQVFLNGGSNSNYIFAGRVYYVQILENDTLKLDLIPCYRKSDNVIGLYDKVSGKFYTNAGTGTFTKGEDIGSGFGDIVGYGQTSQESTTGKNLFETTSTNYINNGTYVSGANTNEYKVRCTGTDIFINNIKGVGNAYDSTRGGTKIPCVYGETIYYDTGNTLFSKVFFTEFDSNDISLGYYQKSSSSGTYTPTNSNCDYVTMRFGYEGSVSGTTYTLAPIISKTAITAYEPYTGGPSPNPDYPQEIEVVTGEQEVIIKSANLYNVLDTVYMSNATYVSGANTSEYKVKATGTDLVINSQGTQGTSYTTASGTLIPLKYGQTIYYDTGNTEFNKNFITQYNSNKVSLGFSAVNTGSSSGSYTPTNVDCEYITIRIGNGNAVNGTTYTLAPIVSYSDISYKPYQTPQTYQLSLGEYEFAKIGNYVDTIEYDVENDKVYKKGIINQKNITDESRFILANSSTTNNVYQYRTRTNQSYFTDMIGLIGSTSGVNPFSDNIAISNYFIKGGDVNSLNNYHFTIGNTGILVLNTNHTTLDDFKTWLNSINLKIYYVLETATTTEITGTLANQIKALYNAMSFDGTTIITVDGDLPLVLKVRALKGE